MINLEHHGTLGIGGALLDKSQNIGGWQLAPLPLLARYLLLIMPLKALFKELHNILPGITVSTCHYK